MMPARHLRFLILGHARHGKDTAAEHLRDSYCIEFRSSSMFLAETVVRPALECRGIAYPTLEACYADRGRHRAAWREIIEDYNRDDGARLARAILAEADCYVGMRMLREYEASRALFNVILWIDGSGRGLPPESRDSMTITFDPGWMLRVDNGGTVEQLHEELDAVMASLSWVRP